MWENDYSRRLLVLANRQVKVSKDFTFSYVHVKKKREQKLPRQFLPCKQGSLTGWRIGGAVN